MKSIRIGKDIRVLWPILTNKESLSLAGRDLKLFMHTPTSDKCVGNFSTEGNVVIFNISGLDQKTTGIYSFTLWENYGKEGQTAVDYCDAFCLVPTTCQEGGANEGLNIESITLESSNLELGVQGPQGPPGPEGQQGVQGVPGVSPTVNVIEVSDEVRLTITDIDGTKETPNLRGPQGIPGPENSPKTYTAVVNTVAWRIQPTIEGPLNSAFDIWWEDYYYVTLKDAFGTALPDGQFRLTPSLTADRTTADPTKAIDQTFMLPDLNTGNAGALTESAPVDFLTTGSDWQLRSAGVSSIKIGIDDEYIQGYDLNIFATTKVYKYGFMQYIPLESLDKSGEIGQNYFALSGFGNGYDFGNQFLFDSPTYVSSSARKHMYSNEVFRLRILPTAFLVEYSRSQMGFDGTLNNRLSVRNITSDTIRANGVGFSLDERNYPVSVLKLRSKIGITGGSNPFLNGSSFRIELIKRT